MTFCIHLKCWKSRRDSEYTSTAFPTMFNSKLLAISLIGQCVPAFCRVLEFVIGRINKAENLFFLFGCIIFLQTSSTAVAAESISGGAERGESPAPFNSGLIAESKDSSEPAVVPVVFPAPLPAAQIVPAPTKIAMPGVIAPSVLVPPTPRPPMQNGRVNVSIMKGEVHMRNLNPKMGSGEILALSTGDRSSCEFKLNGALGRVWQNSDATVFAGSNVIMLNSGELVFSGRHAGEFTVISGDLLCRIHGTTVRVSRLDGHVKFSVMDGTVTVYNRQTGEVLKVSP